MLTRKFMDNIKGLTTEEALERSRQYGLNILPEEKLHPLIALLKKFWAPVPWMLEVVVILEIILGKYPEAWIIAGLLVFNALVSFSEENKAKKALLLLKSKLSVDTRILRDGEWRLLPAAQLVPDDVILARFGDIVPADAEVLEGRLLIDQSVLTGESLPIAIGMGKKIYAGSTIQHGEAYAKVIATGVKTYYGKTAELIRTAETPSHLQKTIYLIIKYLIVFNFILVCFVLFFSIYKGIALEELILFSLLLLVASVPAALPATFTLATALGSEELAQSGVLVARLSAIEEAAAMSVLCVDKTGTITHKSLAVEKLKSFAPFSEDDLIILSSWTCEKAAQDPMDLAILETSRDRKSIYSSAQLVQLISFDPEHKYAEAILAFSDRTLLVIKGAPDELLKMIPASEDEFKIVDNLAAEGLRVIGVIAGEDFQKLQLVGFIGLSDPIREDAKKTLSEIRDLGIKLIMLTGDSVATAKSIAIKAGMGTNVLSRAEVFQKSYREILACDIIAGVFPEDKYHLISLLQKEGKICGMTGDGVNDAPALKKAEVGIAVSNATDVAKASASLVLTKPGLEDIVEAVKTSRRIYQRMLTYAFNKIIKTLGISMLLGLGLILTGNFIISQLLIVLLLFANDFATMSIATDNVAYSTKPNQWNIGKLTSVSSIFGLCILGFSFCVLYFGLDRLRLSLDEIQTFIFLTLVFTGQAIIYLIRDRSYFWSSRPSFWMLGVSVLDIGAVSVMAIFGILMTPIPYSLVLGLLGGTVVFFFVLDFIKVYILRYFFRF